MPLENRGVSSCAGGINVLPSTEENLLPALCCIILYR